MKAKGKRKSSAANGRAATNLTEFRTFLLMAQLEAEAIGQRIQRARNEAGITQEELAELASFSKRSLQNYEAGVSIPYRHMREISGLLNRPVEWFLYGEHDEEGTEEEWRSEILERLGAIEEALRRVTPDDPALPRSDVEKEAR